MVQPATRREEHSPRLTAPQLAAAEGLVGALRGHGGRDATSASCRAAAGRHDHRHSSLEARKARDRCLPDRGSAVRVPRASSARATRRQHALVEVTQGLFEGDIATMVSQLLSSHELRARRPGSSQVARRGEGTRARRRGGAHDPCRSGRQQRRDSLVAADLCHPQHDPPGPGGGRSPCRFADEHAWLDLVWKTALLGPLVTASVQVGSDVIPLGRTMAHRSRGAGAGARAMPPAPRTEMAVKPEPTVGPPVVAGLRPRRDDACSRRLRLASAPARGIAWPGVAAVAVCHG